MPKVREDPASPSNRNNPDDQSLAFCSVGDRFGRIAPDWERWCKIRHRGHRLLHQVGRGRTNEHHHLQKGLDFVINNIVCRYGLPYKIVSDNEKQFDSIHFTDFFEKHGIVKSFSAVARPQANGQAEAVNKILKGTLKKKL